MPTDPIQQILGYGVLGVTVVLLIVGILTPKWVVDEYRRREAIKDKVIESLTSSLEQMAERIERLESRRDGRDTPSPRRQERR